MQIEQTEVLIIRARPLASLEVAKPSRLALEKLCSA